MIMPEQSWSTLPDISVVNCFRETGISRKSQQDSTQDTDGPFAQLAEILDELRVLDHELVPYGLTSKTLIATDEEVANSIQYVLYNEELPHQTTNENVEINDEENDGMESTEKKLPSKKTLFEAVNFIDSFAFFQNDDLAKQL